MKLTNEGIHPDGSDTISTYDVVDYKAKTAGDFVKECLEERKNEWGFFDVEIEFGWFKRLFKSPIILQNHRIAYNFGPKQDIPEEWFKIKIKKVEAAGGWLQMNYYIKGKLL